MKEKGISALQQFRECNGFTRRELAEQCGVNLRTLQDYEQGHKNITSAKADTLFRLSTALGCTMEDLLPVTIEKVSSDNFSEHKKKQTERLWTYYCRFVNFIKEDMVSSLKIYSSEYKTYGRIEIKDGEQYLTFCYGGRKVELPFEAKITEASLPWLEDVAVLKINSFIRKHHFDELSTRRECINDET